MLTQPTKVKELLYYGLLDVKNQGGYFMKIVTIAHILNQHSVPYIIKGNRIYADSMAAFSKPFEEVEDLTDYTCSPLYAWLGY